MTTAKKKAEKANVPCPFVAGASVVIRHQGWGVPSYVLAEVAAVRADGRFTLKGSKEQWNSKAPGYWGSDVWTAERAGRQTGHHAGILYLAADIADEMRTTKAESERWARWCEVRKAVHDIRREDLPAEDVVSAIEAAMQKHKEASHA